MEMLETIIPKSDQLNADDLIGGKTMTITITGVDIKMDEQPVAIHFEGDGGKPYRPGKSMRRVLVNVWGPDAKAYAGRRLTLYRDDSVKFGGMEVGGIRISHMSHIKKPVTMALTATKAQRRPFTVQPLVDAKPLPHKKPSLSEWMDRAESAMKELLTPADVEQAAAGERVQAALATFEGDDLERLLQIIADARARVAPKPVENAPENGVEAMDDGWPGPVPEQAVAAE